MKKTYELDFYGKKLVVELGEMAKQAAGSAFIRYGDTAVLSVVASSSKPATVDFFPLMVLYQEKLYSAGKIPGGFIKREGRPSENATLTSRLIDRPIRPLFPKGFKYDVQVISTVMSVDTDHSPEMAAMFGSSLSLMLSPLPFLGPIAGVVVGLVDGEFVVNPTPKQLEDSLIDLTVAGTKEAINMVEAGAKEVSEDVMLDAIMFGHEAIKKLVAFQEEIVSDMNVSKMEYEVETFDEEFEKEITDLVLANVVSALEEFDKEIRNEKISLLKEEVLEKYEEEFHANIKKVIDDLVKQEMRRRVLDDSVRVDGRALDEIRSLNSQIDILPRVHGSSLFTRGQTQCLSITTLGTLREYQIIDGLGVEDQKRFMLHYNFPAFSVGETGRYGAPGRREIGHGALGERALLQILPNEEDFPYTIRVVSEILESNGSTSQASICAGCMSLMAAGVPIKAPVAGIAMGLISDGTTHRVLSDIQGLEDHLGDMDFKVAGSDKGIVALQMDIKIMGLSKEILSEALAQARKGRMEILDNMVAAISTPKSELSEYAPKIKQMMIPVDKIKDVIGRGGEVISKIIEECDNVKIDIEDDGRVIVYHTDYAAIEKAITKIENITRSAEVNEFYDVEVVRIEKFGAFVRLWDGCDGMVHISQLAHKRVEKVEDVVKIGDKFRAKVIKIDDRGRIDLSKKAADVSKAIVEEKS
ncbi:MAG: polyribonucleotide nucleotidyltransferase [Bacilli bacterium]